MQSPTLSNSCKCLMSVFNPSSEPYMTGTMFHVAPTGYGKRLCFQALPFLMDFKRGLVLILYKANKLDYCLDKPSVKRRTQTFTR